MMPRLSVNGGLVMVDTPNFDAKTFVVNLLTLEKDYLIAPISVMMLLARATENASALLNESSYSVKWLKNRYAFF